MGRLSVILAVICALALAGLAQGFNAGAYLYDGETSSMISDSSFAYNGVTYTLVKINGADTFLLAADQLVTDAPTIASVLEGHSMQTLMPTKEEWASLRQNILDFNNSRNYKTRFGLAEKVCLNAILYDMYPCTTLAQCTQTATMICAIDPTVLCPPAELMALPILNYTLDVISFNSNTNKLMKLIADFKPETSQASFKQMQDAIAALKVSSSSITKNVLRFPESGDACMGCIGRCPSVHLDTPSLDKATALIGTLKARTAPLDTVPGVATQIAQATADREAYKKSSALAVQWAPKWKDFKSKNEGLRANASQAAQFNGDAAFTSAYQAFTAKWADMGRKINTREFSGIDSAYSAAVSSASSLSAALKGALVPYNRTIAAQNVASDLIVQARWKTNQKVAESVAGYNALASRKNSLDAQFKPPMPSDKYASLTSNYTALSSDVRSFIASQAKMTDTVSQIGGQFGSVSVNGVFTLASAITPLSYSTRNSLAPFIPPIVLFLTDLAIVSVAVVIFVGVLLYFRNLFRSKTVLGLWIVGLFAFLFALGVGSIALFAFISSSAASGTFEDFLSGVSKSQVNYIAIDLNGATAEQISSMTSCANLIKSQAKTVFGKGAEIFTYNDKTCSWIGANSSAATPKDSCFDKAASSPLFMLHASKESKPPNPKFSTVFNLHAETWGAKQYYDTCEIGGVLG